MECEKSDSVNMMPVVGGVVGGECGLDEGFGGGDDAGSLGGREPARRRESDRGGKLRWEAVHLGFRYDDVVWWVKQDPQEGRRKDLEKIRTCV